MAVPNPVPEVRSMRQVDQDEMEELLNVNRGDARRTGEYTRGKHALS